MKIYISGKISGLDYNETKLVFERAEKTLRIKGFEVANPFNFNKFKPSKSWNEYMVNSCRHLFECDAIFMLKNWGQSKGARVEYAISKELGLKIIFESEFNFL